METYKPLEWHLSTVHSPQLTDPVEVVMAKDLPYGPNTHRFQSLSIYLPKTNDNLKLLGNPNISLPTRDSTSTAPSYQVHIHGGAWRDPQLTSASIEAAVAHVFSAQSLDSPIKAVISLNYTLSHYPTHPTQPYDSSIGNPADPSREAVHPAHVQDVLAGLALLRDLGLTDDSYVLTGHSAGACLAMQAILQPPEYWNADARMNTPRPAALVGLNGLYDLPDLVHNLGESHAWLESEYAMLLGNAFGRDESVWPRASPARFEAVDIARRVGDGRAPKVVILDQSAEDQLVPMTQREKMEANLMRIKGLKVVRGSRCKGQHAAPWEGGIMLWESVRDALEILKD